MAVAAVTPGDDTRDAELRALERAMGAVAVDSAQDWGGEIADDDDDDTERAAVVYGDDALFDSDDPPPPQGEAAELDDLTGLLGGGGAESSSALIAYLEQMASGLEAQSGEEEREIRGKIAMLRSVLEARSGAVDSFATSKLAGRRRSASSGSWSCPMLECGYLFSPQFNRPNIYMTEDGEQRVESA